MTDASYVLTGWVLTGVVLAGYCARIVQRTRRAERSLPDTLPDGDAAGDGDRRR